MTENLDRRTERKDVLRIEYFPPRLHYQLKCEAVQRGITLRELVIAICNKAVARNEIADLIEGGPKPAEGAQPPDRRGPQVLRRGH